MAYIGPEPRLGQNREVDDISSGFNGNTATFNLTVNGLAVSPGSANAILVSLGGVIQNPGTDYTVSTSTITFTTNPASGLSFFALVLGQGIDTLTIADGQSPTMSAPVITGDLSIADKIVHTGDTNTAIRFSDADTITAETGGSARLTIASDGKVGIGTSSPSNLLTLEHSANASNGLVVKNTNNSQSSADALISIQGGDNAQSVLELECNGQNHQFVESGTGDLKIFDNATERLRLTSAGKFYIGTTDGNSMGSKVVIDSTTTDIFAVKLSAESMSGLIQVIKGGVSGTPSGTLSFIEFQRNDGGVRGSITANGAVNLAFNTSSDYRLKENIVAISDGITRLKTLKPSRFNWKEDSSRTVDGFIAHEVSTAIPEAVTGTKDAVDENGKIIVQQLDLSKIVPLLTAALQEAVTKIETLETKVAALESA